MLTPKKKPKNHVHALGPGGKGRASEAEARSASHTHVRWVWLTLAPDPPHRIPVGGLGPGGQRHCTSWISPGPLLYYYWSTYLLRFLFSQVCVIHVTSRSPAISSHKESESRKTVISRISKGGRFCYYYLHGSFISCAISLKTNHPILSSRTIHGVGTSARSRAHAS